MIKIMIQKETLISAVSSTVSFLIMLIGALTHATLGSSLKLQVKEKVAPVIAITAPTAGSYIINSTEGHGGHAGWR